MSINLGPFIDVVKQRLVDRGFDLRIASLTSIHRSRSCNRMHHQSSRCLQSAQCDRKLVACGGTRRAGTRGLRGQGPSPRTDGAGLGLAAGMLALGVGILVLRALYLDARPAGVLTYEAAAAFYDTLVRYLRLGPAYGAGVWPHRRAGRLLHRPLDHRGQGSGWLSRGIAWLRGGAEKPASALARLVPGSTPTSGCCESL